MNKLSLLLLAVLASCLPTGQAAGRAREKGLPHLIQATTLEEDYRALAGLGLSLTPLLAEENPGLAFEGILCSSVRIQVNGHYGSGSIFRMLEDEIIIVTNRHLLEYWDEDSFVTFFDGTIAGACFPESSLEADVGFLRIPVGSLTYEELLAFRNIRLLGEGAGLVKGDKIFLVDMASRPDSPVRKEGEVIEPLAYLEEFGMEMILGRGEALPGMSGSGIFDRYGNYLGMVTGGTVYGEIAAVPDKVICEEYERIIMAGG